MSYVENVADRELRYMDKPLRLGLLLPSSNTAMEEEIRRLVPDGAVALHSSRARLRDVTPEALLEMETTAEAAALELADAGVDIIEYCCSAKISYEADLELGARLESLTGVRSIPYTKGVVEGLNALDVKRIAVATPYIEAVDVLETAFYEGAGFEILNIEGLGIIDNVKAGLVSPKSWYDFVKQVDRPDAEAIFISCTQPRTIEIVDELEAELQKPVVIANAAALWIMLKETGYDRPVKGCGQLLTMLG